VTVGKVCLSGSGILSSRAGTDDQPDNVLQVLERAFQVLDALQACRFRNHAMIRFPAEDCKDPRDIESIGIVPGHIRFRLFLYGSPGAGKVRTRVPSDFQGFCGPKALRVGGYRMGKPLWRKGGRRNPGPCLFWTGTPFIWWAKFGFEGVEVATCLVGIGY